MQVLNLAVKNAEVSYRVYADAHVSISMQTACSSIAHRLSFLHSWALNCLFTHMHYYRDV